MTEQVQKEEQANPYNMKKPWHTDVEDKEFISADDGLYFQKITPKSNQSVKTEIDPTELDNESQEVTSDQPYKRPDYKKRYDDLKKHYDSKLNEFKSREEELLEEVTKNKQNYTAPKTEEELEQFKKEYPDVYEVVETVAHMQS